MKSYLGKFVPCMRFPDSSVGKESACDAGDPGSIPGLGRSAGEGKGILAWRIHTKCKLIKMFLCLY